MKYLRKSEFRSADLKLTTSAQLPRTESLDGLVCKFSRKYCFHPNLLSKLFRMDSPTGNDQSGSSAKEAETLPDATGAGGDDLDHSKRPSNDTGTEENSSTRNNTGDSAENPKSEEEKPSNIESSSMRSTDEDAAVNVNSESSAVSSFKKEVKTS